MSKHSSYIGYVPGRVLVPFLFFMALSVIVSLSGPALGLETGAPAEPIKLIFIHHSCGENWLADDHGQLGRALSQNNYFVSDTNYGWGPDSIGDRTDIINWPEWFIGPNSPTYLAGLFTESAQNSPYSRTLRDPGGENRIIMFKSCFPNSNLEGRPNDPPKTGHDLTVGNAKAIYNQLLSFFATRPDKLFIVVTAPPVRDRSHSANARAFNTWLAKDWLQGYQGNNVAVFDFYNVLTGAKNHHRINNKKVQYITNKGRNTLYYPTNGDDHPSPAGNRKATKEFVPMLNTYYQAWQKDAPRTPPSESPKTVAAPAPVEPATSLPGQSVASPSPKKKTTPKPPEIAPGMLIDDFESEEPQWAVFVDEGKGTRLFCRKERTQAHKGSSGLSINFDLAPDSWAICSLVYPDPQDWRGAEGISLYLHAPKAGQKVNVVAYQGKSPDNLHHFEYYAQSNQAAVDGWQRVDITWNQFTQAPWEGTGEARYDPSQAMGLAFAFVSPEGGRNIGKLWVDDITFLTR